MNIYMHSRRTIMDGEVVTLATGFVRGPRLTGDNWEIRGPIEVSSGREMLIVHQGVCRTEEEVNALILAIQEAWKFKKALEPTWSGGHASKFPTPDGPVPIHVSAVARVEGER